MQTVSSLVERLDMTPEEAVGKLRHMLFDIGGVDAVLTDEQCDLLIDVDDDPSVGDKVREAKLSEIEKAKQRTERLKRAAKKAAAKRKAEVAAKKAVKAKAKKKAAVKKAKAKEAAPEQQEAAQQPVAAEAPVDAAVTVTEEKAPKKKTAAKARRQHVAEILPPEEVSEKPPVPEIVIGTAVEHAESPVEVVRADGTLVAAPDAEISDRPEEEKDEEQVGLLAEAERRQDEVEQRRAKLAARPAGRPDPAVVTEVKRRAAERSRRMRVQRPGAGRATGKTARKRLRKAEKLRQEHELRRDAAAAVREYQAGGLPGTGPRRRKYKRSKEDEGAAASAEEAMAARVIEVEESMTVEALADVFEVPVSDIILDLMDHEILANKNQSVSIELIRELAEGKGFEVRAIIPEEEEILAEEPDAPADLLTRFPVITVMGHVDHGKTTLLDRVRTANVAEAEVGGITQHIAAYDVRIGDGRVVFLDTPGHEAFTAMRARGAQVTDVVVLVVAADDGVMPQTVEAIDHAKAADVPIVVAINKCDKPDAEPERIRQDLMQHDLVDEQWGGKSVIKDISAKTGEGVDDLMELLVLESELLELKANPKKRARGAIIESEISKGQGPVGWVLVQSGTLCVGDVFLAGETYGRVRAMINSRGETVHEAGPATPVIVTGFSSLADAGDQFIAVPDERIARVVAGKRVERSRQKQGQVRRHITLEDLQEQLASGEKNELNVILKADVQGSASVLESSLAKLGNEEVVVKTVHSGVGGINESDVLLASASEAVVIGFHVTANPRAAKLAEQEGVDIRTYRVIYEVIDDMRHALEGMLEPDTKEVLTGHAEIRVIFRSSSLGSIAGSYVQDGEIVRGAPARIIRDDAVLYDSKIASLRREKDDIRTVQAGFECGIKIENFEDIKVGDIVETYRLEAVAKTLA